MDTANLLKIILIDDEEKDDDIHFTELFISRKNQKILIHYLQQETPKITMKY